MEERARQIAETLGLADDIETLRRVEGFIRVNGFPEVLAAAEKTRSIAERWPIHDPWDYARAVFNHGLGYSSHLYGLHHLAETSLRAWLDAHIASVRGPNWHLDMHQLLHPGDRKLLDRDLEQIQLPGETERGARVEDFANAYELLVHLNLSTLRALIERNYGARPFALQLFEVADVEREGTSEKVQAIAPSALSPMLESINAVRHEVMHHHPISLDAFKRVLPQLERLLLMLNFNLDATIDRTEWARYMVVRDLPFPGQPLHRVLRRITRDSTARIVKQVVEQLIQPLRTGSVEISGIAYLPEPNGQLVVAVRSRSVPDAVQACVDSTPDMLRVVGEALDSKDFKLVNWDGNDHGALLRQLLDPVTVADVRVPLRGRARVLVGEADVAHVQRSTRILLAAQLLRRRIIVEPIT